MLRKIIINEIEHETRVAFLEDGTIVELFIERRDHSDITGNIYKGRVQRVLPGMQAAFVDIGLHQAAFLYVDDIISNNYADIEAHFIDRSEAAEGEEDLPLDTEGETLPATRHSNIEELISEGQDILVYAAKAPIGSKGARVTTYISLPGRFLVLMPNSSHVGVSRRITDETERLRLRELLLELRRDDTCGYIARTACEGIGKEKMAYEMGFLKNLWENIRLKYKTAPAPSLLHKELNVSLRAVRDLLTHDADKLVIDSRPVYNSVLAFLDTFMPSLKDSVELFEGREPIFDAYNLEGDISRALRRKVWLKSGGYIVIEQTEALVAIDVNTGRYVGKHNQEETILKTNLDAIKEIAYQVRLRDIGGIIIIDFIDMAKKANQEKVFDALKEALKKDRSKTHVLPISELGLVQMTRKRIRQPLNRILCESCFYCEGEGYLSSRRTICYNIYREVMRHAKDMQGARIMLMVNAEIAEMLRGEENRLLLTCESVTGKQIIINQNPQYHLEQYDLIEVRE